MLLDAGGTLRAGDEDESVLRRIKGLLCGVEFLDELSDGAPQR